MAITTTTLTRTAGLCAVVGGLLFVAVQINHPPVDLALVTTTEWKVRQTMKVFFAALSLAGITGMYLRQVRQTGILGLIGYVVFAVNFLVMLSVEITGAVVLPTIADSSPGYVSDVLAAATGGTPTGDIGALKLLSQLNGVAYLAGGLIFGLALFRTGILARWASALLAAGTVSSALIPVLPQINQRLFAVPVGVAIAGLGYSLWREQRTSTTTPAVPGPAAPQFDPAAAS